MPRVVVIHPPISVARDFIDYPYMSDLGAVQVAAVLRAEGFDVTLVDAFALPRSGLTLRDDGRLHMGAPVLDVLAAAAEADAELYVVAYTPFHRPPHRDDVLASLLAGLAGRVVLADCYQSGQHYVEAEGVLEAYPEADTWLKYEAERTLPGVLRDGARGTIRGVEPDDLDALPLPAWDLVDLAARDAFCARVVRDLGRGAWAFPIDGRTLPVVTSRGCPFRCVHCSSNPGLPAGASKTQRRLSNGRMRALFSDLAARGATRFEVLDELVNVNERHFEAFLDLIEQLPSHVAFDVPNGMRADYLFGEHLRRMRGRVHTVSVSAESGVQRVASEVVGKRLELSNVSRVAEEAHREGVSLMIHFMIGLPGESAQEINATLAYALDLWDRFRAFPAVQFATPLPGTQLARGLSLPVVTDWGPQFQTAPSGAYGDAALVTADELRKFKWTFDARLSASNGPSKVIMNVTYVCNNRCTFCAVGTRTQVDGHPTRQREYLDEYRRRGVHMVDFDGGEPTLNPELIPLIRHARRIGYDRVNVTTNGRMCFYEDFAQKLVSSGLTTLLFSVHGPDEKTHAQQVGVAEAFEQTTGGIRNARKHAPQGVELGMNVTVTKGNWDKLEQIALLALELGLPWLNIQFLTPFGRATSFVAPDTQAAADEARRVIDAYRDRMKLQLINLPFCFMPGYEEFLTGDLLKLERHMIFVNNDEVNLAQYLAERRTKKPVCATCPHACFCGGFYELETAPEPPWLIAPEDLLRPVRRAES